MQTRLGFRFSFPFETATYVNTWKTETANYRSLAANGNGKWKFVFLGRQRYCKSLSTQNGTVLPCQVHEMIQMKLCIFTENAE
jgi:hypothetical protein